jgi:cytochrome b561
MSVIRYHAALVALHWLLGFLILVSLFMGTFALEPIPNADPAKIDGLRGHMIAGALIGVLMILRLIVRSRTTHPPQATVGMAWADAIAPWMHWALYVLVFVMVASGFAMSFMADLPAIVFGGSGQPLPETFSVYWPRAVHGIAAKLLFALIVLHTVAALYHQFVRGDGLLRRMWFGRRTQA